MLSRKGFKTGLIAGSFFDVCCNNTLYFNVLRYNMILKPTRDKCSIASPVFQGPNGRKIEFDGEAAGSDGGLFSAAACLLRRSKACGPSRLEALNLPDNSFVTEARQLFFENILQPVGAVQVEALAEFAQQLGGQRGCFGVKLRCRTVQLQFDGADVAFAVRIERQKGIAALAVDQPDAFGVAQFQFQLQHFHLQTEYRVVIAEEHQRVVEQLRQTVEFQLVVRHRQEGQIVKQTALEQLPLPAVVGRQGPQRRVGEITVGELAKDAGPGGEAGQGAIRRRVYLGQPENVCGETLGV